MELRLGYGHENIFSNTLFFTLILPPEAATSIILKSLFSLLMNNIWSSSLSHLVTPYIHILQYCMIKSDKITRIFFPPMHISFHRQAHLFRAINSQSD